MTAQREGRGNNITQAAMGRSTPGAALTSHLNSQPQPGGNHRWPRKDAMKPQISMRAALCDTDLFQPLLGGESWRAWRILLIAAMGEALDDEERVIFEQLTGRPQEPGQRVDELWCIVGRRGGKTRAAATLAAYLAALTDFSHVLAPGERATLPILSASVWQAQKAKQYLSGAFATIPALKRLVEAETGELIGLRNRVDIECRPASFRTARGSTAIAAICDEVAFWRSDESRNPDSEILAALRPSLATTGGPLICISSPYARKGELYEAYRRDYGANGDPQIMVAKAPSLAMNGTLNKRVVERAYEKDPAAAAAEYGADFRSDIEAFLSLETVQACIVPGISRMPPSRFNVTGTTAPSRVRRRRERDSPRLIWGSRKFHASSQA